MSADGKGRVLLISTFFIILITVLINGGAASYLLARLRLRAEDGLNFGCATPLKAVPFEHCGFIISEDGTPSFPPFLRINLQNLNKSMAVLCQTNCMCMAGSIAALGRVGAIAPDGDCGIGEQAVARGRARGRGIDALSPRTSGAERGGRGRRPGAGHACKRLRDPARQRSAHALGRRPTAATMVRCGGAILRVQMSKVLGQACLTSGTLCGLG